MYVLFVLFLLFTFDVWLCVVCGVCCLSIALFSFVCVFFVLDVLCYFSKLKFCYSFIAFYIQVCSLNFYLSHTAAISMLKYTQTCHINIISRAAYHRTNDCRFCLWESVVPSFRLDWLHCNDEVQLQIAQDGYQHPAQDKMWCLCLVFFSFKTTIIK